MLFNSVRFLLLFLPIFLWGACYLKGQSLLQWITVSSFIFYALAGRSWFLIPMLITTVLDFYLAKKIEKARVQSHRRLFLFISLCGNLGLLIYFKYSGLILRTTRWAWALSGHPENGLFFSFLDVMLPAGISFYTFQTLSYIIDVYKGVAAAETNFWEFAAFVSFFPHLVAGPLTRHHQLIPQLKEIREEGVNPRWDEGFLMFALGLCKKTLIADRIAVLIDPRIGNFSNIGLPAAWLLLIGYALQIYFDFSGYTDMAIGLARLCGIELPQNFNSPYQALNPSDFWRRWHMTLSQWLRDYLYFPLGGSQRGTGRNLANIVITMFLGGLWHGAHWTFALWGLYHGAFLAIYHVFRTTWDSLHRLLQRLITFVLISLGWILFRSTSFAEARSWFSAAIGFHGLKLHDLSLKYAQLACLLLAGLAIVQFMPNSNSIEFRSFSIPKQVVLGALTVLAILFMNYSSKFLYFQF